MSYLITCSGSKKTPSNERLSSLDNLYRHNILGVHRQNLLNQSGIILDWNKTLPAFELYCGPRSKIYKKIRVYNWQKECVDVLILSALFGWIRHNDLIPTYDLSMNQRIGNMLSPTYIYWRNLEVLSTIINNKDVDLLSDNYKRALSSDGIISAVIPNGFVYSDRGDCVGYWLENELNNLVCTN